MTEENRIDIQEWLRQFRKKYHLEEIGGELIKGRNDNDGIYEKGEWHPKEENNEI